MWGRKKAKESYCVAYRYHGETSIRCFSDKDVAEQYWNTLQCSSAMGIVKNGRASVTKKYVPVACSAVNGTVGKIPFVGGYIRFPCEEHADDAADMIRTEGPEITPE